MFNMLVEGEGLIKDDTKVTYVWGVRVVEPLMEKEKLWVNLMRDFGPMMMTSDLSQLGLRKLV